MPTQSGQAEPTVEDIEAACGPIAEAGLASPQIFSPGLSERLAARVYLKLENLQPTGSFKVRGALIKLSSLSEAEKARGVIAVSAGNHAQGVAFHARRMGVGATIVMPRDTPFTKVRDTERLGATIVLEGRSFAEARTACERIAREQGLSEIHPYDDPKIIAGQGTLAVEFLRRYPQIDCLVVPVGGGGLIAGVALVAHALNPKIEIVGVQCDSFPSMRNAIQGESRPIGGRTAAEGIAVAEAGVLTRAIAGRFVTDIVLVSEDEIERAMHGALRDHRMVAEGAGAAAIAAVLQDPERYRGREIGLIVSGGNVDGRLLSSILLRGLARDGLLVRMRVEIEDRPGELGEIAELIGRSGANIIEVVHQRLFYDVPVKQAEVDITLETRDPQHVAALLTALSSGGFPAQLLSNTAEP